MMGNTENNGWGHVFTKVTPGAHREAPSLRQHQGGDFVCYRHNLFGFLIPYLNIVGV